MFTRLVLRRIASGLLATVLFTLLHPLLAMSLVSPGGPGDGVQVCTGFGMVWLRIDGTAAAPQSELSSPGLSADSGSMPARGDAAPAAAQCPLCAGAAMLPEWLAGEGLPSPWPALAQAAAPGLTLLAPPCARLILDAPTRGPPPRLRLA